MFQALRLNPEIIITDFPVCSYMDRSGRTSQLQDITLAGPFRWGLSFNIPDTRKQQKHKLMILQVHPES